MFDELFAHGPGDDDEESSAGVDILEDESEDESEDEEKEDEGN